MSDALMQNFADPRLYTDAFLDNRVARHDREGQRGVGAQARCQLLLE